MDEPTLNKEVNCQLSGYNLILDELKENLLKAQHQIKKHAYTTKKEVQLKKGDWLFLKLQPYCLHSLTKHPIEKLQREKQLTKIL